jgi:hypothetical protein
MAEEFNDWYDLEHVPERAAIAGFHNARRFVCVEGWPRYLALYDLEHVGVLQSPAYRAVAGDRSSPWSKRILPRIRGLGRTEAVQIAPGEALLGAEGPMARLALCRFRGAAAGIAKGLLEAFEGALQVRAFRTHGEEPADLIALAELRGAAHLDPAALGGAARHLVQANLYVPYFRQGPPA